MVVQREFEVGGVANAVIDLPIRGFFALFAALPHKFALDLAGWTMARLLAPVFGLNRRISANLRLIFPDMPKAEINRLCAEVSANSARLMLESFDTKGFIRHAKKASLGGEGKDQLLAALAARQPVVLVSGHFGNYQVLRVLLAGMGHDTAAIYRPMNNAFTNTRYIRGMDLIAGPNFPRGMQGTKGLLSHLRNGGAVALLNDQFAHEGAMLNFMGQPAMTMLSAAEFALKFKALLIPYYGIRAENGVDFHVEVEPPVATGSAIEMTQALNDSLEGIVRRYPGQWFWVHKRWKSPE